MRIIKFAFVILIGLASCKGEKNTDKLNKNSKLATEETQKIADTTNMVFFKGGTITIGSNNGIQAEMPAFEMKIEPFYIDKNLVTVAEFRKFVNETSFKTDADKFGDSGVFSFETNQWELLPGANWEYPLGRTNPKAEDNHPVTHVSWRDAMAYAKWTGKRLPTEFEWEFAAKSGKNNASKYAWGDNIVVNDKYMANVWQGTSILKFEVLDGYLYTSPVGAFPETEMGLTDMGGNVWQWCSNYYKPYPEIEAVTAQDTNLRSIRGGSFMFDKDLDNSFTTTFRSKNSIDTSLFNLGFRCAK